MSQNTTFEQKFKAFVPDETRVSNNADKELIKHMHDDVGLLTKWIAYLIDIGVSVFIIPIIYNIYHYLKRWQTLWQQLMGIRIYRHHHVWRIASITHLLMRFMVKLFFLATWTIIGINLMTLAMIWWPSDLAHTIYLVVMLVWIHLYIYTMFINKHRRWLHDLWSGTIVAYDHWFSLKRFIIWAIFCGILYYVIIWLGPDILHVIEQHISSSLSDRYRTLRNWIDMQVFRWLAQIHL